MIRKKSKFWLFWFSLVPGAGEMYLGFMKMGVSLMGFFLGLCFLASFLDMGSLLFFNVIIWFYGFFHAHNLSSMPDEEFYAMEDKYLVDIEQFTSNGISGKLRTFIAYALIAIGSLWIFNNIMDIIRNVFPDEIYGIYWNIESLGTRFVAGVGIIYVGVQLIRGKGELK